MAYKATSGTLRIINDGVGKNQRNAPDDVASVQELLRAAGENIRVDRQWGDKSQAALIAFQKRRLTTAPLGTFPNKRAEEILTVGSPILSLLAYEAGVLLPVIGEKGIKGFQKMHDWLVANKVQYQTGAEKGEGNRAVWGLFGNSRLAIQTAGAERCFQGPILLDCTTYTNLMMAIYHEGNLHGSYNAALQATGGGSAATEHLGKSRWGYELLSCPSNPKPRNYHRTTEEILAATESRQGKLFQLEVGSTFKGVPGFVRHMALMYGHTVYECTPKPLLHGSACISRPLAEFMKNKTASIIYLFAEK
jgi:hypothetical protein